jgi:diadenosine tetraphosphate (Ap4A) HIT family hydrolase
MVCHVPVKLELPGTLCIESRRHFLDYAEMTNEESASLGDVMRNVYYVLRLHTSAERIYQVTLLDGIPHYHSWLVPRRKEDTEKGMKFLVRNDSCGEEDATALANKLREMMK